MKKWFPLVSVIAATFIGWSGIAGLSIHASMAHAHAQATVPSINVNVPSGTAIELRSPHDYHSVSLHFIDNSVVPLQFSSVRYYLIPGTASKTQQGAFEYPYSITTKFQGQLDGIEVARDDVLHNDIVAIGIPTADSAKKLNDKLAAHGLLVHADKAEPFTSGAGSAPLHLIWHDPVNIWLVEVFDILHWTYSGTYVTGYTYPPNNYEHWFSYDLWNEDYHSYSSGISQYATWAYDNTQATFSNYVFCNSNPTYIGANDTAYGYFDGIRSADVRTSATGGCTNLLGYYWQWG